MKSRCWNEIQLGGGKSRGCEWWGKSRCWNEIWNNGEWEWGSLTALCMTSLATTDWMTLVRSRQSMQLNRNTPSCLHSGLLACSVSNLRQYQHMSYWIRRTITHTLYRIEGNVWLVKYCAANKPHMQCRLNIILLHCELCRMIEGSLPAELEPPNELLCSVQ